MKCPRCGKAMKPKKFVFDGDLCLLCEKIVVREIEQEELLKRSKIK